MLDKRYFEIRKWSSSTKLELLAIWYVLLMAPRKKKVRIYTDSAAAIASLEGKVKSMTNKQRLRKKNYNLVENIRSIISIKELSLELVKVKGHSNNKWNNRADRLVKERSKLDNIDRVIQRTPIGTSVNLCQKKELVEDPTRQFIKEVLDLKTSTDWRFSAAIEKLEPTQAAKIYDWSYFWKKIKSQNGSSCTSMKKNKQIGTLIKCVNEKLPVVKSLAQ